MKPLLVLLSITLFALLFSTWTSGVANYPLAGRIGMAGMLLFTAAGHFIYTQGMIMMMPTFMPAKKTFVYLTGLLEIGAAVGLLVPRFTAAVGWLLILFFILILPANVKAATQHIDYQKGSFTGSGSSYLWFRIPLQLLFIAWVYWFAIRS